MEKKYYKIEYLRKKHANEIFLYGRRRDEILKRDNFKCVLCGSKENLEIHHKDGNGSTKKTKAEKNNKLSNLQTLCTKCHHVEDRKLLKKKRLGMWALHFKKCVSCGETKHKHISKGLCSKCAEKKRSEYKKEWYKKHKLERKVNK